MTPPAPWHSCVLMLHSFTTRAWWVLGLSFWNMPELSGKKSIDGITWSFSTFRNSVDLQCLDLTNWSNPRSQQAVHFPVRFWAKTNCKKHDSTQPRPLSRFTLEWKSRWPKIGRVQRSLAHFEILTVLSLKIHELEPGLERIGKQRLAWW